MNRILIKSAVLAGLFLGALAGVSLIYLSLAPERQLFPGPGSGGDVFRRLLRGYDDFLAMGIESRLPGRAGPTQDQLNTLSRMLDRIEKNAQGVEAWLSALKRRRDLAFRSSRFLPAYREATGRAAAAFPWSQPIAAMAAEALLYGTSSGASPASPEPEDADALKSYASLITETRFSPLVLAIRVLTGELDSPARAQAARIDEVLALSLPLIRSSLPGDEGERLNANLGLLLLLKGDYTGASGRIRGLSAENRSPALRRLAAEYFYDFGEPLRAAEIFYQLDTGEGMLRSADALWLGDSREAARNIWRILSTGTGSAGRDGEPESPDISPSERLRSLYNLAASTVNQEEAASWLSAFYLAGDTDPDLRSDPLYPFGIIRYTRLMEPPQAIGILEGRAEKDPLADLELLRRQAELRLMDRTVADTWLLLGRHPGEERIYQWGAWYFNFQRKYEETGILIKTAGRRGIGGAWLDLNTALPLMREGKLEEAEGLLRAIPPGEAGFWQASANLGRILESRHAPRAALEQYGIASSLVNDPVAASRIQFRMAGCFRALGQTGESREALRRSLELNPDNLPARLELQN
jgi:tetratricopeptide (TPR) repeat protein